MLCLSICSSLTPSLLLLSFIEHSKSELWSSHGLSDSRPEAWSNPLFACVCGLLLQRHLSTCQSLWCDRKIITKWDYGFNTWFIVSTMCLNSVCDIVVLKKWYCWLLPPPVRHCNHYVQEKSGSLLEHFRILHIWSYVSGFEHHFF